ncbi:MAG: hypothetical protein NTY88_15105 [Bacteroidetes bacterium]|nr:hypothetical protein [Bacteroidota bacterium]
MISGLTNYGLLHLVGETGSAFNRSPTVKHFIRWCQLNPRHSQYRIINERIKRKNKNKAGARKIVTTYYNILTKGW